MTDSGLQKAREHAFERVARVGVTLPRVQSIVRYDGAPVLQLGGAFMAGLAVDDSAEPDTIVVRVSLDTRDLLLEDAAETYYLTAYYRPHPVVLARLARLDPDALHGLLMMAWRETLPKSHRSRASRSRTGER